MRPGILLLLLATAGNAFGSPYSDDPESTEAVEAAADAVARLGADRGALAINASPALTISHEVVAIVGLDRSLAGSGMALSGRVEALEQAIQNLDAVVEETMIRVDLASDVLFDFDKASLKPAAEQSLNDLKLLIEHHEVLSVAVIGHTDAKGSEAYNRSLSLKRAESVRQWLVSAGIGADLIQVEGRGELEPVAPNTHADGSDNPEGRAKNRRVAVLIQTRKRS